MEHPALQFLRLLANVYIWQQTIVTVFTYTKQSV